VLLQVGYGELTKNLGDARKRGLREMPEEAHLNRTVEDDGTTPSEDIKALREFERKSAKLKVEIDERQRRRSWPIVLFGSFAIALGFLALFAPMSEAGSVGAGLLFAGSALLVWMIVRNRRLSSLKVKREIVEARQNNLRAFVGANNQHSHQPSYFDSLVKINVDNLTLYYALVKTQTERSFWVAVWVGVVGYGFLLLSFIVGLTRVPPSDFQPSWIAAGAGILTEFISATFFYLYNKTVRQMRGYHDSLLAVQNVLLSFKLIGETRDETERTRMVGHLVSSLIGLRQGTPHIS
jgi:protein-S-isoprenylcysteine O-methyltransferase Ste14